MRFVYYLVVPVYFLLSTLPSLDAQAASESKTDSDALEKRLENLEQDYQELVRQVNAPSGGVRSFLGSKISLGGFFEAAGVGLWGPNTMTQVASINNIIGINLAVDFSDQVRFVGQIVTSLNTTLQNPHNNPNASTIGLPSSRQYSALGGGTLPLQGYIEYRSNQLFNLRGGFGYVPFGIAYQYYEPVLFRRRGGPQLTRSGGPDGISFSSLLWTGLHLYGSSSFDKNTIGYNLYSVTPTVNTRGIGAGSRLWWKYSDLLTLGTSFQTARRINYKTYQTLGFDLTLDYGPFGINAEYARALFIDYSETTYYAEPYWKLAGGTWLINGVADFVSNPGNQTANGSLRNVDPYEKWEYGVGLNWLPRATTRFRLTYLQNVYSETKLVADAKSRNYQSLDLSAGVSF